MRGTRVLSTRYNSILDTIGNTPVVQINNIDTNGSTIWVKAEYFNPLSSVKDRLAYAMVIDAEKSGKLKPGQTIVEATSGNTGVSLAMVCAARGYPFVAVMAESFSIERRLVMKALGAKVVLTPAPLKGSGMVSKAQELAKEHGFFETHQFENQANVDYHAQTTGAEILRDFAGKDLDYFVSGYGTGGTVSGAGKTIKAARPSVQVVLSEPEEAPLVTSGTKQERNADQTPAVSHPAFSPHAIQGWAPDFIPACLDSALADVVDSVVKVSGPTAIASSLQLARQEGIFCGISAGATFASALELSKTAPKGSTILAMLPDTGERYLSGPLFADIKKEMNDDEIALSKSTPGFQLPEE